VGLRGASADLFNFVGNYALFQKKMSAELNFLVSVYFKDQNALFV